MEFNKFKMNYLYFQFKKLETEGLIEVKISRMNKIKSKLMKATLMESKTVQTTWETI